jgi:calcineurin-like phosphoesterase family protein
MIWFTSDTHYHHKNIVAGVTRWDDKSGCRDFATIEEMDNTMVENINRVVQPDDVLFHLGDWAFKGPDNIYALRNRINCKTVHLILGNHDTDIHGNLEIQSAFTSVAFYREVDVNGQKIILCHYPLRTWNKSHYGSWMLHGHCHGRLEHQIPARLLRELIEAGKWDVIRRLANNEDIPDYYPNGRTLDVGIDTHTEFRPYSIVEVAEIMKERTFMGVDSHG